MRRVCALLLTAAFGLGVVGCGDSGAPPTKPVTPPKPTAKPDDKEKKATPAPDKDKDEKKAGGGDVKEK